MSIGERIAELRREYRYSQEYVAEKLGVSRQAVSKWEGDLTAPDTYNLIALAELFGVSVEYLATGKMEEIKAQAHTESPRSHISERRVFGYILFSLGFLSMILGLIFSIALVFFGWLLLIDALIFFFVKKHTALVIAWAQTVFILLFSSGVTGLTLFLAFVPSSYSGSVTTAGLIISLVFWALVAVEIFFTVRCIVRAKKKR